MHRTHRAYGVILPSRPGNSFSDGPFEMLLPHRLQECGQTVLHLVKRLVPPEVVLIIAKLVLAVVEPHPDQGDLSIPGARVQGSVWAVLTDPQLVGGMRQLLVAVLCLQVLGNFFLLGHESSSRTERRSLFLTLILH